MAIYNGQVPTLSFGELVVFKKAALALLLAAAVVWFASRGERGAFVDAFEAPLGCVNTGLAERGGLLYVGAFDRSSIVVCDELGRLRREIKLQDAPADSVQGVAWYGEELLVCHYSKLGGDVRLYAADGKLLRTISPNVAAGGPNGCAIVDGGVWTAWDDAKLRLFDLASGEMLRSMETVRQPDGVAVLPNGNLLITSDRAPTTWSVVNIPTGDVVTSGPAPASPESPIVVGEVVYLCCDQGHHMNIPNGNRVWRAPLNKFLTDQ